MQQHTCQSQNNTVAILIPAYNPDQRMLEIAGQLDSLGFPVVIVDDGSSPEYASLFEQLKDRMVILRHAENRGKGAALKLGIRYLRENMQGLKGFVTADADGQHLVPDIVRVAQTICEKNTIILGVRNLKGSVPLKSRIGNAMSRFTFAQVTGRYLTDNQTGLRGFSFDLCNFLERVEGMHYEYEMNVLIRAVRKKINIRTVSIETVYHGNNITTHFKPLKDTCMIQLNIIKHGLRPVCFYMFAAAFAVIWAAFHWPAPVLAAGGIFLYALHVPVPVHRDRKAAWMILVRYLILYGVFLLILRVGGSPVLGVIASYVLTAAASFGLILAANGRQRKKAEYDYETM